ncbi:MAG: hypothetical protein RL266_1384 [Bacteroidota bacterium]|jgi:16S rRNA (guanine(966)-N(2))-methyltransferase RsmD
MRIISGLYKGRTIRPPKNLPVRPTTDKAKEGLFNILNNLLDFEELNVLDLFCGTGNIGLEFASRGALTVTSVDADPKCAAFVRSTYDQFGYKGGTVVKADAFRFAQSTNGKWNMIFADPPYTYEHYTELVTSILERKLLTQDGMLILEHPAEVDLSSFPSLSQTRKYGRVHFSFFELEA